MEEVILFAIACFCLGMMAGYWIFFRPLEHINEDIDEIVDEIDDSYYNAFTMLSDNLAEALEDVDEDGKIDSRRIKDTLYCANFFIEKRYGRNGDKEGSDKHSEE